MNDLSIPISKDAIAYAVESIKVLLKLDSATQAERRWIETLIHVATVDSSTIQCVGMIKPAPIEAIYVELGLLHGGQHVTLSSLAAKNDNAIISGGPGDGKTTFLRWAFMTLLRSKIHVPLLITLRRPGAVDDLTHLVNLLTDGTASRAFDTLKHRSLLLLIDGYDEITTEVRKKTSEAILKFESLNVGQYYLTCRSHYHVFDLKAPRYNIASFEREHAKEYATNLALAQGSYIDAELLISELDGKGFTSFWKNPLLLTLIMILKSSPSASIPSSSIGLIRRAISVLSFRWDNEKGLERESPCDIDAPDREQCLMFVAYNMNFLTIDEYDLINLTGEFLLLLGRTDLIPRKLLEEIAGFYGLLVPKDDGTWTFTHRTIHDYLAAKYAVENGKFDPWKVREWNARAAYSCCFLHDATASICIALRYSSGINILVEILNNTRRYSRTEVTQACITHYAEYGVHLAYVKYGDHSILVDSPESEWIASLDQDFLQHLIGATFEMPTDVQKRFASEKNAREALRILAMWELLKRNAPPTKENLAKITEKYSADNFHFIILDKSQRKRQFSLREFVTLG